VRWQARISRQKEIAASIAAKAEFEYLYDRPYSDNSRVRVAGPFTVESLSPHRVVAMDQDDSLIHEIADPRAGWNDFPSMVLDNLKTAGVQQAHKEHRIFLRDLGDRWQELDRLADLRSDFLENTDVFIDPKPYPAGAYRDRTTSMREIRREGIDL
jgi:hypothetical protein